MIKLDNDNIIKHKTNLEKEECLLPILLTIYIDNFNYINNLKKKNMFYGHIQNEIFERREKLQFMNYEDSANFEENEFYNFIKEHPEYEDIII